MKRLFRPKSIAVVGASPSHQWLKKSILSFPDMGYEGKVYAVNPRYSEVAGAPCFPSLSDIPEVPDAILIGLNRDRVLPVVEEAISLGIGGAVVLAIGFAEAGEIGRERQQRMRQISLDADFALVGPNCQGLVDFTSRTALYMGKVAAYEPGVVALISQSGSVTTALTDNNRGVRWSQIVSAGNEAVVDSADLLRYFVDDPGVKVIGAFLETIRDPERFFAECDRAKAAGKPVVVLKSGTSEAGAQAAAAHSGALAAPDRLYDALFARHGVHRARSMEALLETLLAMQLDRRPRSNRMASITASGGQIELILDQTDKTDLTHVPFTPDTAALLRKRLPDFLATTNPLDYWGMDDLENNHPALLHEIASDPNIDIVLSAAGFSSYPTNTDRGELEERLIPHKALAAKHDKVVVMLDTVDGTVPGEIAESGLKGNILVLSGLSEGLEALSHLVADGKAAHKMAPAPAFDVAKTRALFNAIKAPSSGMPTSDLLTAAGLPVVESRHALSADAAVRAASELGYPVVMKVADPSLLHKTEVGGVLVGVKDALAVTDGFDKLSAIAPGGVVVQPMMAGDVELFAGFTNHEELGPFLIVGTGGIWAELFDDVSVRPVGLAAGEARAMLESLKGYPLLRGVRGKPACDIDAVVALIEKLDAFAREFGDKIAAIDLNPIMVTPKAAVIVDTLVIPKG
ncbi:acetate--CoA ligase family protein [Bosea sp. (in: a-proteobacteria)]|uniref:acetate--CoA ligase family protein n=1 Tax=Bosea sp. (in: a-proteobacteria) TaxID=1871050 RepID=UPI00261FD33F|nr:acetate--CoA ligase family protein [Bosea sp. (in: a-proteobacteria)]MCO5092179.1 acetate--CoA ligase family protein [Bosea sp. (in: a-proteobacteria)]